jgi:Tol biopolymer transport system component
MGRGYAGLKVAILFGLMVAAVLTREDAGQVAEKVHAVYIAKLGATTLWATPQDGAMLVPGVNTEGDEYGPTFTPDGKELCYTTRQVREKEETIVCASQKGSAWSAPKPQAFSGNRNLDKEPYFSPDGKRLFFASQRAFEGRKVAPNFDVWMVERTGASWSAPVHLDGDVNTAGYENYPAVSARGTLFFARRDPRTQNDLFAAREENGKYHAMRLPDGVNTEYTDADPYVAPDESYMIFSSDRPGGLGEGDLYVTRRSGDAWSAPKSLGRKVNSTDYEYTPFVTADGQWLYFSRGWGDIWRIRVSELELK